MCAQTCMAITCKFTWHSSIHLIWTASSCFVFPGSLCFSSRATKKPCVRVLAVLARRHCGRGSRPRSGHSANRGTSLDGETRKDLNKTSNNQFGINNIPQGAKPQHWTPERLLHFFNMIWVSKSYLSLHLYTYKQNCNTPHYICIMDIWNYFTVANCTLSVLI